MTESRFAVNLKGRRGHIMVCAADAVIATNIFIDQSLATAAGSAAAAAKTLVPVLIGACSTSGCQTTPLPSGRLRAALQLPENPDRGGRR